RGPGVDHEMARSLDLATVYPRVSPDEFRRNLDEVARFCAERGITLVFVILNDNVTESVELEAGTPAVRAGRSGEAEGLLRAAGARNNVFSDAARLELAALYERDGRLAEASTIRVSGRTFYSLTGGFPIVPGEVYRAVIREVAATRDVKIVDAGTAIDRDPHRYLAFCHFDPTAPAIVPELLPPLLR